MEDFTVIVEHCDVVHVNAETAEEAISKVKATLHENIARAAKFSIAIDAEMVTEERLEGTIVAEEVQKDEEQETNA